jgi:hypothetical protein
MLEKSDAAIAEAITKIQAIAPDAWAEMVYGQMISGMATALYAGGAAIAAMWLFRICKRWANDDDVACAFGKAITGGAGLIAMLVAGVQAADAFELIFAPSARAIYSLF